MARVIFLDNIFRKWTGGKGKGKYLIKKDLRTEKKKVNKQENNLSFNKNFSDIDNKLHMIFYKKPVRFCIYQMTFTP